MLENIHLDKRALGQGNAFGNARFADFSPKTLTHSFIDAPGHFAATIEARDQVTAFDALFHYRAERVQGFFNLNGTFNGQVIGRYRNQYPIRRKNRR